MEILDHENIVNLKETIETADALYLVMEYVKGHNLEEYLKSLNKSYLPEHEARLIFRQLVKAVDHCHSKWVVHRDLKVNPESYIRNLCIIIIVRRHQTYC
jgi:serine/threonine protein kinase